MKRAKLPSVPQPGKQEISDDEYAERTQFCYEMVRQCKPKGEIKTAFRAKFTPDVEANAKTIEKHITEAKQLLVADAADGLELMRAQSLAMLTDVATDEDAQKEDRNKFNANKIAAIRAMATMFGLNAPTKVAPTDPSGEKEYESITDEERASRIAAILQAARDRRDRQADAGDK